MLRTSARAAALAEQLGQAADELIALLDSINDEQWLSVRTVGEWSPSKDAEHVADGAVLHQWQARLALGHKLSKRPTIEREQLTARTSRQEVMAHLRQLTRDSASLVQALTDEQLNLPAQPPRTRPITLAQMISDRMIGHYHSHREAIAAKLR